MTFAWVKYTGDFGAMIKGAAAALNKVWNDTYQSEASQYTKFYTIVQWDGSRHRTKATSGASDLRMVPEGWILPELALYDGLATDFQYVKFGWIITVTEEAIDDNDFTSQVEAVKQLAIAGMIKKEAHAFSVLKNGWTTSEDTDLPINRPENGETLFSIAHAMKNGETFSNTLVNSDPLSADAVSKAKTLLLTMKSENGQPFFPSRKFALVVPVSLEDEALRITGSTLRAGTNYNDVNTHAGIEVISSQFLEWNAWFLVDKKYNGLYGVNRKEYSMDTKIDFESKNVKASIYGRWAFGFRDYRGIVGSKGDGSTVTA